MNRFNIQRYVKLWQSIERKQREVDDLMMKFASDLRTEFPSGDDGDAQFSGWMAKNLHLTPEKVQVLVAMAAVAIIGDDIKRVGGARQVHLIANRPVAQIREIAKEAVKENLQLSTVARRRDNVAAGRPPVTRNVVDHYSNARALAVHLATQGRVPPKLRGIVHHYVPTPTVTRMPTVKARA